MPLVQVAGDASLAARPNPAANLAVRLVPAVMREYHFDDREEQPRQPRAATNSVNSAVSIFMV